MACVISHLKVTEEISVRHGKETIVFPLFHKTFLPECKNSLIFTLSLYGIFRYLTKIHPTTFSTGAGEKRNGQSQQTSQRYGRWSNRPQTRAGTALYDAVALQKCR
jgi:hypothetical protein